MDSSSARLLICSSEGGAAVELSILPSTSTSCSTGLVYDSRVCAHANPEGDHPEHPERVTSLWSAVRDGGLASHCVSVPARLATRAEVELVHEVQHWDRIEWAVGQELNAITAFAARHESLYLNGASLDSACCAAGGVLELTTKVVTGQVRNGMALVRPPGHHAEAHAAMGFSVFNTVAMAAQHARSKLGCRRVLIVDWDVHHGNGIQHIFEADPDVLYFSVHRYESGRYFPSSDMGIGSDGAPTSSGVKEGLGTTINIGWNTKGSPKPGDAEYLAAWRDVLMPVAREFDPDLVIVAAGFDAAEGDPIGRCRCTPECYASLTSDLMTLAGGKVVLALEGGYSLSATAVSAAACMEALIGVRRPLQGKNSTGAAAATAAPVEKPRLRPRAQPKSRFQQHMMAQAAMRREAPAAPEDACEKGARKAIEETRQVHAQYWRCLRSSTAAPFVAAVAPLSDAEQLANRLNNIDLAS